MPVLMGKLGTSVNGPEGLSPFDGDVWDCVDWRHYEEQVRRLRGRIFKAVQEVLNRPSGLLGPYARERACAVLRGPRCSNAPGATRLVLAQDLPQVGLVPDKGAVQEFAAA
jgi:hypothetical protein